MKTLKTLQCAVLNLKGDGKKEAKEDEKKAFADINIIVGKWQYFNIFSLSFRRSFSCLIFFFAALLNCN